MQRTHKTLRSHHRRSHEPSFAQNCTACQITGTTWTSTALYWTTYTCRRSTWPTCTLFYWFQPSTRAICETVYNRQPGLPGRWTSSLEQST